MKTKFPLILFLTFLLISTFFYSCEKDSDTPPNKTPEEILTANSWKIEKIRTLQDDSYYYYQRGSVNTDLDNEYITFKTDHTGTYIANNGAQSAITSWNFVDAEKTLLQYTIAFSTPLIVNWENLQLTPNSIKYGEYHNLNGINMSIATRIPK